MSKLVKACIGLAAFVALVVVPAAASAAPLLTAPTGTSVPVGANIVGKNVGNTVMTNSSGEPLVTCEKAEMTGTLNENSGTSIRGTIETANFTNKAATECTGSIGATTVTTNPATNGLPWCIEAKSTFAKDEFRVRGNSCASAARPIRFVLDVTTIFGTISCTYQRAATEPITGTYTTHPEDARMTISKVNFPLLEGGFGCPESGALDMTFTLERETGGGLFDTAYID